MRTILAWIVYPKRKKNIKVAQKQNLDIQFGHKELLDDFDKVMKCTEERKVFL